MPRVETELLLRIETLERRCTRLRIAITLTLVLGLVGLGLSYATPKANAQGRAAGEFLTIRGLAVVDEKGTERVRIGAPLPDPIVQGKRVPRQGQVSGILLFDSDGDERGGYVTNAGGDAFLTLDAKSGQQTVFLANRDGGANLAVWSGNNRNDNYVSVRAVPTPLIEIVQGGKRVFTAGGPDAFSK